MADCTYCGQRAGMMKKVCQSCELKQAQQMRDASAAQARAEQERVQQQRQAEFNSWRENAEALLAAGNSIKIYDSIYLDVDSISMKETLGEFDIAGLQRLGLDGWSVVAVIPRTHGMALENVSYGAGGTSKTWAGGIGGTVIGVYVILEKTIDSFASPRGEWALRYVSNLASRGMKLT